MWLMLLSWLKNQWKWIIGIGAGLALYLRVRQDGANSVRQEIERNNVKAVKDMLDVKQELDGLSDSELAERMRKYSRTDK